MGIALFTSLILIATLYQIKNSKKMFLLYITVLTVFIIVMRLDPKGVDFVEYYQYLHYFSWDLRHIREITYFMPSYLIYTIVHNEIITFIMLDMIWLALLIKMQKNINTKYNTHDYALIMILFTSFPLFFGYENIYRQLFAEIFALYAYSIRENSTFKSNIFFIVAIFMHNTALVILPFLIVKSFFKLNFKIRLFLVTAISLVFNLLFTIASHYKSGHETGLNMSIFYFLIFIIGFYVFIIKNKFNFTRFVKKFPSIYIGSILMYGLVILPDGMIAERMGMFFLVFLLYDLYMYSINMKKNRQTLFRLSVLLLFSLPVLVFNSSRMML